MILKLLGIFVAIIGFAVLKFFPDISYQRPEMLSTGLFLGALMLVIGVALIIFG
jgi:hypothetical protein